MSRPSSWVLRRGRVLTGGCFQTADVAVVGEQISAVGDSLSGFFENEIDCTGKFVVPGVIDGHVHFNEPGRTHWEGFASGSGALAAGGGAAFVDMPLNASPPTIDAPSFDLKRAAGEAESVLDFGLWGGLVPGNLVDLPDLAARGVVGFKAFMVDSGIADFPCANPGVLRDGMRVAADLGLPVAVHAEDPEVIANLVATAHGGGKRAWQTFVESRPVAAEIRAAQTAIELAGDTGCALQIVHASCREVVALVSAAKQAGLDVTVEACPHHLLLDESAMESHGVTAKCAPPLRSAGVREALWRELSENRIDCIGSDHSPAPPEMKAGDFLEAWGGIMGCQHGFLLVFDRLLGSGRLDVAASAWECMSARVAKRLGLGSRKGSILAGHDADLVVLGRSPTREITAGELLYRHKTSPYVGRKLGIRVEQSWLRGTPKVCAHRKQAGGSGQFLPRNP